MIIYRFDVYSGVDKTMRHARFITIMNRAYVYIFREQPLFEIREMYKAS